jgi:hypothetical protein
MSKVKRRLDPQRPSNFGYLSGREQPTHGEDIVLDASLEYLDNSLIETYLGDSNPPLSRLEAGRPNPIPPQKKSPTSEALSNCW